MKNKRPVLRVGLQLAACLFILTALPLRAAPVNVSPVRGMTQASINSISDALPIWVTQSDVITLAKKLSDLKLNEAETEILQHTVAGIIMIGEGTAGFLPDGYFLINFQPLADVIGPPAHSFVMGHGGVPDISVIEETSAIKISTYDLISLSEKLNGLKLAGPEREILRHIAAGIAAEDVSGYANQETSYVILDYGQMLKILGPPENALVADSKSQRLLIGLFPSRG